MNYFPRQHYKRQGARQTAACSLCGQWVNVQDLILCDVQGLRGFYVCSSHPWEKMARVNPSFQDRGGVGQVMDPGHDMLPAPGTSPVPDAAVAMLELDPLVNGTSYASTVSYFDSLTGEDFTVEALIYMTAAPASAYEIVNHHDLGTNEGWRLYIDSTLTIKLFVRSTSWETGINAGAIGRAIRISATHSSAGAGVIYVDGAAVVTNHFGFNPSITVANRPLNLGEGVVGMAGRSPETIADVRVFNNVRTADEIGGAWNRYISPSTTGLVFNCEINEGVGSTLVDLVAGHNMTVVSGAGWTTHTASTPWGGGLP